MSNELTWGISFDTVLSWFSERAPLVALALLLLLLLQSIRLYFVRRIPARRMDRHRSMGDEAERRASTLLKRHDYRIVSEQLGGSYVVRIDEVPTQIHLRADFIVKKRGRCYVAEVKSGAQSAKVTDRTTRRQLLEYLLAFDVDGVLLVDMHEERIRQVEFPTLLSQ